MYLLAALVNRLNEPTFAVKKSWIPPEGKCKTELMVQIKATCYAAE